MIDLSLRNTPDVRKITEISKINLEVGNLRAWRSWFREQVNESWLLRLRSRHTERHGRAGFGSCRRINKCFVVSLSSYKACDEPLRVLKSIAPALNDAVKHNICTSSFFEMPPVYPEEISLKVSWVNVEFVMLNPVLW